MPTIKEFTYVRRYSFRGTVVATTDPLIVAVIRQLQPNSKVKFLDFQIWFGIADDPVDESIEFWLAVVDQDGLPTQGYLQDEAAWSALQNWRSIGTDSGPVQTIVRDRMDTFSDGHIFSNTSLAERRRRLVIAILTRGDVSSNTIAQGSLAVEITIQRRIWPGKDVPADDLSFEEWHSDGA